MANDDSDAAISQSALPTPLVGYQLRGDDVVVTTANSAFETAFGEVPSATSLTTWLTTRGVDSATAADIAGSLAAESSVDTQVRLQGTDNATATRYRFRSIEETGSDDQYCLLTEQQPASTVEIDRLASVISHDLRNPLDVANAHLREARETGNEEHFDQLKASHDRMERIIRDVLTLARGERALDLTPDVDLGSVAAAAWETVDTEAATLTTPAPLPTLDADPDRLTRLFENLFRNSVEHGSADRHIRADDSTDQARSDTDEPIEVRVGPVDGGFYVADDGVGIPGEERDRVFDPGYTTEPTSAGTGLGLTIVEEITEAHDWTVSLTDSAAGGARFEFRPVSAETP